MSAGSHNSGHGMGSEGNIDHCKSLHPLMLLRHMICCLPGAIDQIQQRRFQGRLKPGWPSDGWLV